MIQLKRTWSQVYCAYLHEPQRVSGNPDSPSGTSDGRIQVPNPTTVASVLDDLVIEDLSPTGKLGHCPPVKI